MGQNIRKIHRIKTTINFEAIIWAAQKAGHTLNYTSRKPLVNGVGKGDIQF